MLKIVVCIKQVPDTAEMRIDPVTNTLVRDGVKTIMPPCKFLKSWKPMLLCLLPSLD